MLGNIKKQLGILENDSAVFHQFIANKLNDKIKNKHTNNIKRKEVVYLITRHMSSNCVHLFLNEMEEKGFIKQTNKQNIELIRK